MGACQHGRKSLVRLLLQHGADVAASTAEAHATALSFALEAGCGDIVELLLQVCSQIPRQGACLSVHCAACWQTGPSPALAPDGCCPMRCGFPLVLRPAPTLMLALQRGLRL